MPNFDDRIDDFAAGDNKDVFRTLTEIEATDPLVTVYMTVKRLLPLTELDDAAALWKKTITDTYAVGAGQIFATGATEVEIDGVTYSAGTGRVLFTLLPIDTILIRDGKERYFDFQCVTLSGKIYTSNKGVIVAYKPVTLVP